VDLSDNALSDSRIKTLFSLGVHPWFVKANTLDKELKKIENHMNNDSFLAVGECGLDKVCDTDFDLQVSAFKKQIELAEKYKKPLVLHVVKAFNELVKLSLESKPKQIWIVHGFNGSPQLAKQLTDLGMCISFGSQLEKHISKASSSVKSVPINRLFLETDTSELSIQDVYALAAERLNTSVTQLQAQLWQNFQKVFL